MGSHGLVAEKNVRAERANRAVALGLGEVGLEHSFSGGQASPVLEFLISLS